MYTEAELKLLADVDTCFLTQAAAHQTDVINIITQAVQLGLQDSNTISLNLPAWRRLKTNFSQEFYQFLGYGDVSACALVLDAWLTFKVQQQIARAQQTVTTMVSNHPANPNIANNYNHGAESNTSPMYSPSARYQDPAQYQGVDDADKMNCSYN